MRDYGLQSLDVSVGRRLLGRQHVLVVQAQKCREWEE
jgi:hypothetical protein